MLLTSSEDHVGPPLNIKLLVYYCSPSVGGSREASGALIYVVSIPLEAVVLSGHIFKWG